MCEEQKEVVDYDFFEDVEKDPLGKGRLSDLPNTYIYRDILRGFAGDGGIHYKKLRVDEKRCFLFSGCSGTGRHTLVNAFIQSVCEAKSSFDDSKIMILGASDFMSGGVFSEGDPDEHIKGIFETAKDYASNGNVFIVFDEMELYPNLLQLSSSLSSAFEDSDEEIYLIMITENHAFLSHELLNQSFLCRCNIPTLRQREKYFKNNLVWTVRDWSDPDSYLDRTINIRIPEYDFSKMAENTEGFTYRDLSCLAFSLRAEAALHLNINVLEADVYIDIDKDTVEDFIDAYMPEKKQAIFPAFPNFMMVNSAEPQKDIKNKKFEDMNIMDHIELINSVAPMNDE